MHVLHFIGISVTKYTKGKVMTNRLEYIIIMFHNRNYAFIRGANELIAVHEFCYFLLLPLNCQAARIRDRISGQMIGL